MSMTWLPGIVDRPATVACARPRWRRADGLASSGLHLNGYSLARKVCTEGKTLYELTIARDELEGDSVLDAPLEPNVSCGIHPLQVSVRSWCYPFARAYHRWWHC